MELINNYIEDQINLVIRNCSDYFSFGYICLYLSIVLNFWRAFNGRNS